jgi:predicted MPP superfamily phosphohydrolase
MKPLFFTFVLLALLGDARIFVFILNRVVFGAHRDERSPYTWLIKVLPPVLLALTALFWPLNLWIDRLLSTRIMETITPDRIESIVWSVLLAKLGAGWLIIAASVGVFWIVERIRVLSIRDVPLEGIRTSESSTKKRRLVRPLRNEIYDLEVTRHELFIDDLPEAFDGYRIAFMTDTHVAPFLRREYFRGVVAQVQRFDPHLVLLGGDFVTFRRHIAYIKPLLLDGLTAHDGVYAILGNHDYWAGASDVIAALESGGVTLLTNRSIALRRGEEMVNVLGIDEIYRGTPDIPKAFERVGPSMVTIGVSHHPDIIDELDGRRIDLLVCGHTHGGQIRLPFFGAIFVPSMHEGLYASGFHRVRNVLMYVSRGIGGIPPVRILCKPELATFTLRKGKRR